MGGIQNVDSALLALAHNQSMNHKKTISEKPEIVMLEVVRKKELEMGIELDCSRRSPKKASGS